MCVCVCVCVCVCGCNVEIQSSTWMVEPALKQDCLPPDLLALQKIYILWARLKKMLVGWVSPWNLEADHQVCTLQRGGYQTKKKTL